MQPDEVLRLDQRKCLALFQRYRPAPLDKLTPEELPDFGNLATCRVLDYVPAWKQKAREKPDIAPLKKEKPPVEDPSPVPQAEPLSTTAEDDDLAYDLNGDDLGMVELTPVLRQTHNTEEKTV